MKFTLKPQTIEAITFDELVEHGRQVAPDDAAQHGGMAWAFQWNGHGITHHDDNTYLVKVTGEGGFIESCTFCRNDPGLLACNEKGELFFVSHDDIAHGYEPEEPDTSPMGIAGTRNEDGTTNVAAGFLVHGALSNPDVFPQMAHLALENYLKRGKVGHDFQHETTGLTVSLALFGQDNA